MTDGGTVVRVLLDTPAARVFGSDDDEVNLAEVVRQMCPTSDVTIITRHARGEQTAVTADDWSAIDATELLLRTPNKHSPSNVNSRRVSISIKQVAKNVRPLQLPDGSYLGRAAITPCPFYYDSVFNDIEGVVTVGGLKACRLTYIAGVLLGTSQRASRDSAIPVIPDDVLTEWASEQAKLAKTRWSNRRYQYECANAIAACGGDTGDLPIGFTREGMLSADGVKRWASSLDEIVIVQDAHIEIESRTHDNFEQGMNVIATFTGTPGILQDDPGNSDWPAYRDESSGGAWPGTLEQRVLQAITHAWNLRLEDVVAHRKRKTGRQATAVIGEQNGRAVTYDHVSVLRRGQ